MNILVTLDSNYVFSLTIISNSAVVTKLLH